MRRHALCLAVLVATAPGCSLDYGGLGGSSGPPARADGGPRADARVSRNDGAIPPPMNDAGPRRDGATPPDDAGRPGTDAGRPGTDAGRPGTDAGRPRPDAGPPRTDAGPPDAGPPPPRWRVIETMTIPVVRPGPTPSMTTLRSGVTYRLRARGWAWVQTGTYEVDAEYWDFASPKNNNGPDDQGIAIDDTVRDGDMQPDWGPYNPSHVYTVNWVGAGRPIQVYFIDGAYGNNSGTLTLEILELR